MSNPNAASQPLPDNDDGVMFVAASLLIPLFAACRVDDHVAYKMARSAIEAYGPQSRADYVNIARTLAFSMSALALLGQTAAPDMPMPEKLRAFGRANALNRSADQSERTMMHRRRAASLDQTGESPLPYAEPDDAAIQAAIDEAMRIYAASTTDESAPARPEPPRAPAAKPPAPPVRPAQPSAISYAAPQQGTFAAQAASYRQHLLQRTVSELFPNPQ